VRKLLSYLLIAAAILLSGSASAQERVTGDDVVAYARTFLGTPYKLGASGPRQFDCSSYTRYVYKHFGYELTAYSAVQLREGRPVKSYRDLQKGDLVFFGKRAGVRAIAMWALWYP
jgi:cell wall-associated NlpC family hydrolase